MRDVLAAFLFAAVLNGPAAAMTLTSADLAPGAAMPSRHVYPRCGGQNISPALAWSRAPLGAKSFVLTMIDRDVRPAGWSHWIVVDLPPTTTGLTSGVRVLPNGARGIDSNFGETTYDGPCPPKGSGRHHYEFSIWALPKETFAIAPDAPANDVTSALSKLALDHASLIVTVDG